MTGEAVKSFYHAISQERLLNASSKEVLPGLSTSQIVPEGTGPGIWISDEFAYVLEQRHGEAYSQEEQKPRAPIILELQGIDEGDIKRHPIGHMRCFYEGDMPWTKVRRFYVDEEDKEAVETALKISETLKNKGADIDASEFNGRLFREALRETKNMKFYDPEGKV